MPHCYRAPDDADRPASRAVGGPRFAQVQHFIDDALQLLVQGALRIPLEHELEERYPSSNQSPERAG